jgi:hypothetical protein
LLNTTGSVIVERTKGEIHHRRLFVASAALGLFVLIAWVSFILRRATAIPRPAAIATAMVATTLPFFYSLRHHTG